jgi:hypothetical protein
LVNQNSNHRLKMKFSVALILFLLCQEVILVPVHKAREVREEKKRCKRLFWLIPIFIGIAAVAAGVSATVDRKVKDEYEKAVKLVTTPAPTTPATTTTTSTPRPPSMVSSPPAKKAKTSGTKQKTLLVNYNLEDFNYIPRGLITFDVQPVAGFEDRYDAEFMVINPDYSELLNPDRLLRPHPDDGHYVERVVDTEVNDVEYTRSLNSLDEYLNHNLRATRNIQEIVQEVNVRLRDLQQIRFMQRAQGHRTEGAQDRELSRAFYYAVRRLADHMDFRSRNQRSLLKFVRKRECL